MKAKTNVLECDMAKNRHEPSQVQPTQIPELRIHVHWTLDQNYAYVAPSINTSLS